MSKPCEEEPLRQREEKVQRLTGGACGMSTHSGNSKKALKLECGERRGRNGRIEVKEALQSRRYVVGRW